MSNYFSNQSGTVAPKLYKFKVPSLDPDPTAPAAVAPVETATTANTQPSTSTASPLLAAMWRSPNRTHQIGTLDRQTKQFKNFHVNSVSAAVIRALDFSASGMETYFACAEYKTPNSRIAANVSVTAMRNTSSI